MTGEPPAIHWLSDDVDAIDFDEQGRPICVVVGDKVIEGRKPCELLLIVTPNEPTNAPNLP